MLSTTIRRRVKAPLAVGAATGLALILGMPPAAADPNGPTLPLECDVLGSLEVIVAGGNATLLPGLVADGTQVGVPYRFRLSGVFAPTGGEPQPFVDDFSHPAPNHDRHDHCTFHQEGSLPDGTFVIDGEVWITYTPA